MVMSSFSLVMERDRRFKSVAMQQGALPPPTLRNFPVSTRHANSSFELLSMRVSNSFNIRDSHSSRTRLCSMMKTLHVLVVLALLALGSGEEGARLLASKSLLNRYAVEGRDLTLQYNIYNVGSRSAAVSRGCAAGGGALSQISCSEQRLCSWGRSSESDQLHAALEVELSDDSFPPEDFGIVSGMLNVKWDRIAPASNVSHTVVLRPLKAGYFNFTSASVSYLAQEGGQVLVGYTSAPGQGGILAQREFDRRFSPHYLDWAAFGVMTLPSIGIPLLLWYSSKRKYDSPKAKKN
ncbi:SWI/SNF and RSC complex subunit Ssr2 [Dissostichus eleginoides]|nr:SWI/SNF and RSC complex subunit Ssr2 [Dissostichus eleginoides]